MASDEKALQKAVAVQPISVAICADPLQFYSSGIVDNCCTELDHGVLVVGYGEVSALRFAQACTAQPLCTGWRMRNLL